MVRVSDPLRLLTVHAHPDDESSKGAPTVAKYRAEGIGAFNDGRVPVFLDADF